MIVCLPPLSVPLTLFPSLIFPKLNIPLVWELSPVEQLTAQTERTGLVVRAALCGADVVEKRPLQCPGSVQSPLLSNLPRFSLVNFGILPRCQRKRALGM